MIKNRPDGDYQTVKRSRRQVTTRVDAAPRNQSPLPRAVESAIGDWRTEPPLRTHAATLLKPGHALSYAALFIFTTLLYVRPGELYPSALTASIALVVGIVTLAVFIPTQFALEGNLTARPTEVNLVLAFGVTGLLSIPLAINPPIAWQEFSGTFIRCIVIFIVIVNIVRTETRLRGLLFLAIGISVWLSAGAINDYRSGLLTVEGYRAAGRGAGIFGNTNDMALHVVTILPICIALMFGSKGSLRKLLYAGCAAVMLAGIVLSYSRGAFLGLVVAVAFLALKMGPRHRAGLVAALLAVGIGILLFAPDKYGGRLLSILMPSLDPAGSADARRGELLRSLYVALRHPLLGIGMGNYQPEMSNRGLVTHNSYTQVAAEMGMTALACYVLFIVTPLRKLGQIARETFDARHNSHFYYLTIGVQASLITYLVSSFFLSVSYVWYVYYLVGFAVCLRRLYEANTGKLVVIEKRRTRRQLDSASLINQPGAVTT